MNGADAWELARLDGLSQAELVRSGEVTPEELVFAAFRRIDDVNDALGAVVWRYEDALSQLDRSAAVAESDRSSGSRRC